MHWPTNCFITKVYLFAKSQNLHFFCYCVMTKSVDVAICGNTNAYSRSQAPPSFPSLFLTLTAPEVERKQCAIFKYLCTCTSMHVQKPDYRSLDGEATQCSWQTLWLCAKYRVYTQVLQLFTLNLCGHYFFPSPFLFFLLGV